MHPIKHFSILELSKIFIIAYWSNDISQSTYFHKASEIFGQDKTACKQTDGYKKLFEVWHSGHEWWIGLFLLTELFHRIRALKLVDPQKLCYSKTAIDVSRVPKM